MHFEIGKSLCRKLHILNMGAYIKYGRKIKHSRPRQIGLRITIIVYIFALSPLLCWSAWCLMHSDAALLCLEKNIFSNAARNSSFWTRSQNVVRKKRQNKNRVPLFSELLMKLKFSEVLIKLKFSEVLIKLKFSEVLIKLKFSEVLIKLKFSGALIET